MYCQSHYYPWGINMSDGAFLAKIDRAGVIKDHAGERVGLDNEAIKQLEVDNDELDKKLGKAMELLYDIYEKSGGKFGVVRPKTVEQGMKEQETVNTQLLSKIEQLEAEIKNLKKGDVVRI